MGSHCYVLKDFRQVRCDLSQKVDLDRFSLITEHICWGGGRKIYEVKSSQREKNEIDMCNM